MDNLSLRLKDVREAGVYRLGCRLDELDAAVLEADCVLFEVDLTGIEGKEKFIAAIAQAVCVPNWFGRNWDALADTLRDLSWQPSCGYVLLLRNDNGTLGMAAEDHNIAMEIFADTVAFWKSQDKPFWVFFC
ncbi:MAG: Barstar (barnase inhibitor) [Candidatus Nitrotoga sp. SPKER]|nr:MAG: Barstar (barnase inhibitor) [Candidatus Nitrotoga sp. SPKER]